MRFLRSFATVGGFTLASRILGFVRDLLFSRLLGAGAAADAFFAAFQFPNLFRRLFAEGAFSAAFVPLFARKLEGGGPRAARTFAEESLSALLPFLLVLTAAVTLFADPIAQGIAPGFRDDPVRMHYTIVFLRIVFPYLLFMSATALYAGVLNGLGRFGAAAAAPTILNVVLITVIVTMRELFATPGHALSMGVFVAGMLQTLMMAWACRRAGFPLAVRIPKITPEVKRLAVLAWPALISGGAIQINTVIGGIIASFTDGARSWLYYAERLYQLPLGLVGVGLGVVLLPEIARRLEDGDVEGGREAMNRGLELALLLTLPAAAALAFAADPIIAGLFQGGRFLEHDVAATADALAIFAIGLPFFIIVRVLQPGFYAREDTATPAKAALIGVAVNTLGALALYPLYGFLAVPIATGLAMAVNSALLALELRQRGGLILDDRLIRRAPRIALAAGLMGAAIWGLSGVVPVEPFPESWARGVTLFVIVIVGALLYVSLATALRAADPSEFRGLVFRRRV